MIIDEIIVNYYKSDFDYLMNITSKLFVVSAPSGAGKTTLVKSLIKGNENIKCSTSHTTRAPRINEKDSLQYSIYNINILFQYIRCISIYSCITYSLN